MKRKVRSVRLLAPLLVLGAVASGQTWAWTQYTVGQVGGLRVYSHGQGFQFHLVGQPNLCQMASDPTRGEVSLDDPVTPPVTPDGVKAMLETLRDAKIHGYNVRVFASDIDPHSLKGCTVETIDFDSDSI